MTELHKHIEIISHAAKEMGLDPYPMHYEKVPEPVLHTFASSAMPTRFHHWSFGKQYQSMGKSGKLYELVLNTNPCYAFLLHSNTLLENKLIAAHVIAHSDFFKNNFEFKKTSTRMFEQILSNGREIAVLEKESDIKSIETLVDAAMSIQEQPDILKFILENSEVLDECQKKVLSIILQEALYFRPQIQTKIMNEGWATFFHLKLMRQMDLSEVEVIDYARMHASVIAPQPYFINPYLLGLRIFEDIEKNKGLDYAFMVRATENDVSFVQNYLTEELMKKLGMYGYQKKELSGKVTSVASDNTKEALLSSLRHGGFPKLRVEKGGSGELIIHHDFDGRILDHEEAKKTVEMIYPLWKQPIHLNTYTLDKHRPLCTIYDGKKHSRNVFK